MPLLSNQSRNGAAWAFLLVWGSMLGVPRDMCAENDEPIASESSTASAEIKAWVAALSAREFSKRRQATRKLLADGPHAISALQTAATSPQSERRARAVSILEELSLSTDPETWKPAQAAL